MRRAVDGPADDRECRREDHRRPVADPVREIAGREFEHDEGGSEHGLHDHDLGHGEAEVVALEDREDRHREERHHEGLVDAEQRGIARQWTGFGFAARGVGRSGHRGPRRARGCGSEGRVAGLSLLGPAEAITRGVR